MVYPGTIQKMTLFVKYGNINRPSWYLLHIFKYNNDSVYQIPKKKKTCKAGVNHNITRGASVYSGPTYLMSCDQL